MLQFWSPQQPSPHASFPCAASSTLVSANLMGFGGGIGVGAALWSVSVVGRCSRQAVAVDSCSPLHMIQSSILCYHSTYRYVYVSMYLSYRRMILYRVGCGSIMTMSQSYDCTAGAGDVARRPGFQHRRAGSGDRVSTLVAGVGAPAGRCALLAQHWIRPRYALFDWGLLRCYCLER